MSPMMAPPTEKPGAAPRAWTMRQAINSGTDRASPTPREPSAMSGKDTRKMGRRPSGSDIIRDASASSQVNLQKDE
jgi:hypothetical protein